MLVLLQKRYVLSFESGVIVIKHWRMNNYLKNDRHKETTYIEEMSTLTIDQRGAYTECLQNGYQVETTCIQSGDTGKDSIGKVRKGKDKEEKITFGEYKHVKLTQAEYDRLADKYGSEIRDAAIDFLDKYLEEKPNDKSASHNLAIQRWVIDAVKEKRQKAQGSKNPGFNKMENTNNYDFGELEKQLRSN